MEIRTMDHLALIVADVERSRRFYLDILDMEEIPRPRSFSFPGAWVHKGTAELHIIGEPEAGRAAQVNPNFNPSEMGRGFTAHIAFEIDDVEQTIEELRAKSAPLVSAIRERGDGVLQLYLRDPDGYIIELFSRTGTPL